MCTLKSKLMMAVLACAVLGLIQNVRGEDLTLLGVHQGSGQVDPQGSEEEALKYFTGEWAQFIKDRLAGRVGVYVPVGETTDFQGVQWCRYAGVSSMRAQDDGSIAVVYSKPFWVRVDNGDDGRLNSLSLELRQVDDLNYQWQVYKQDPQADQQQAQQNIDALTQKAQNIQAQIAGLKR